VTTDASFIINPFINYWYFCRDFLACQELSFSTMKPKIPELQLLEDIYQISDSLDTAWLKMYLKSINLRNNTLYYNT
jgi:hypothetical protein